jgi:hypothetical protein
MQILILQPVGYAITGTYFLEKLSLDNTEVTFKQVRVYAWCGGISKRTVQYELSAFVRSDALDLAFGMEFGFFDDGD